MTFKGHFDGLEVVGKAKDERGCEGSLSMEVVTEGLRKWDVLKVCFFPSSVIETMYSSLSSMMVSDCFSIAGKKNQSFLEKI